MHLFFFACLNRQTRPNGAFAGIERNRRFGCGRAIGIMRRAIGMRCKRRDRRKHLAQATFAERRSGVLGASAS